MKQLQPVNLSKQERESNKTKLKRMNKRFASKARKQLKVQYDTVIPKTTAAEVGNMESALIMGKREMQRQEKPMAWEVVP